MKTYKRLIILLSLAIIAGLSIFFFNRKFEAENVEYKPKDIRLLRPADIAYHNARMINNVTYSRKYPKSQMDILLPKKIKKNDRLPLIIWTHGGGFIAGDKKHKNPYLAQLAEKGFIVANMNYALAPEFQYPTPIAQEIEAAKFLKKNKYNLPIDQNQFIIGGDSAGAQIASQFAAIQTNRQLRNEMDVEQSFRKDQIKAVVLFGGLYNMSTVRATKFPRIELFLSSYTGERLWEKDYKNIQQLSSVKHINKNYPPTFLTVGDADPFDSQAREFVKVLKRNNVPYKTSFFDGTHNLKHQYQFHMNLEESQRTYKKLMIFLGNYTNQSPYTSNTAKDDVILKRKKDKE